jgi:hypothetical protein
VTIPFTEVIKKMIVKIKGKVWMEKEKNDEQKIEDRV